MDKTELMELKTLLMKVGASGMAMGIALKAATKFEGTAREFLEAGEGTWFKCYNASNPGGAHGMGNKSVAVLKEARREFAVAGRAEAVVQEAAAKLREDTVNVAKEEIEREEVDLKTMAEVVAWMQTAFDVCRLGELLNYYRRFKQKNC